MKTCLRIFIISIFCFSVQSCSSDGPHSGGEIQARALVTLQACQEDSECMLVQEGCCSCNMGGKKVPINSDNTNEYKGGFKCDEVSCLAMMSNDPSCDADANVLCLKGVCSLNSDI